MQFLLHQGVTVLASTSSERKAAYLRELGIPHVLRGGVDLAAEVRRIVPDGVAVVYDSVGRATFEASLRAVRSKGAIVAFGQSSGPVPPMDIARLSGLTGEGLPGSVWLTWAALTDYNAVLGYEQTADLLRDDRFSQPGARGMTIRGISAGPVYDWMVSNITNLEGAEHFRLRRLVSKAFARRSVDALRPVMRAVADELIDRFAATGECEFMADFAGDTRPG